MQNPITSITINPPADFSFREALLAHGWRRLAPFACDDSEMVLRRTHRFSTGAVGCLVIYEEDSILQVGASIEADPAELISACSTMFQLEVPMTGFYEFCGQQPKLSQIPERKQGRLLRSPSIWEDCVKVILTTNTTWSQTVSMTERLVETYGERADGGAGSATFPTPERIALEPFESFSAAARVGYRAQAIYDLAQKTARGELNLDEYLSRDFASDVIWKRLIALRGIGPYAAACMSIYLGRFDRVNVDSWARTMVSKELGRAVTDKEVHAFFEPYGDWRALVYHFYPWRHEQPEY